MICGRICEARASNAGRSRKKYVSPMVRWLASERSSGAASSVERSQLAYSPLVANPDAAAASARPRSRSGYLSGGKCRPVRSATRSLNRRRTVALRVSRMVRARLVECRFERARFFRGQQFFEVVDQYEPLVAREYAGKRRQWRDARGRELLMRVALHEAERGVDDEHDTPFASVGDEQFLVRVQLARRHSETATQIENGEHFALNIQGAEHDGGRVGKRR